MKATLGGLNCEIFPEARGGKPEGVVVLCHGFGAPGNDLVPLCSELLHLRPKLNRFRYIFPEAPLSLGPGSKAWWMIDFAALERIQAGDTEALKAFRKLEPEGMPKARAMLKKLVDEVSA